MTEKAHAPRRSVELASPTRLRFAKNIKAARQKAGLSQIEVSEKTGITRTTISDIEAGKHNVSLDLVDRLANAVSAKVSDLV